MKIFILRHEDRPCDCTFFSPLTENGLNNSIKLSKVLQNNNINKIFSSPFIRTLQTVDPFTKDTKQSINLEYGLCEIHHQTIIPVKSVGLSLPEYLAKKYNYNPNYTSFIKPTGIKYPENATDCENRMKRVLKNIIETYYKTDDNILIVTHQSLCNTALKIINKYSVQYKHTLDDEIAKGYQKGKVSLIFSTDQWVYTKLN